MKKDHSKTAEVCLPKCRRVWKYCRLSRLSGKCSEKDYERLFIRDPEVKAREGKMAYVRPEYHERIMRITRVIGHDRLTLSAYIDHVLTHHFNQCEDAIKSLYARNYNSVF